MGCGSSKVGVIADGSVSGGTPKKIKVAEKDDEDTATVVTRLDSGVGRDRGNSAKAARKNKRQNSWMGSSASVNGNTERGSSATSKFSTHSTDSGFEDKTCQNFITEDSNADLVNKVAGEFTPVEDLDLSITGRQCPQRLSAKDRDRLDEQRVLAALQEEGLISTGPKSRAAGGLSFEIIEQGALGMGIPRPPVRLAKLEKRRKKKKKELTAEEIKEKLEKAEERRKAKEQERLEKIAQVTNKSDVQNALDAFAQMQKSKEIESKTKEEIAAENRDKRLAELREKQRAKQEHAERVRQRKLLNTDTMSQQGDAVTTTSAEVLNEPSVS